MLPLTHALANTDDTNERESFWETHFEHNQIQICIESSPVSGQNRSSVKQEFKTEVHKVTAQCEYIITSTCWIAIDHYCQHIKRMKNPGAYDVDNIIKPILDSLVGLNGVLIDDVIADRVTVNWIDTPHDDYLEIDIQYPDLLNIKKNRNWFFLNPKVVGVSLLCNPF